jgi:hypothetical protein
MSKAMKSRSPKARLARLVAEIIAMAVARRIIRRIIDKF